MSFCSGNQKRAKKKKPNRKKRRRRKNWIDGKSCRKWEASGKKIDAIWKERDRTYITKKSVYATAFPLSPSLSRSLAHTAGCSCCCCQCNEEIFAFRSFFHHRRLFFSLYRLLHLTCRAPHSRSDFFESFGVFAEECLCLFFFFSSLFLLVASSLSLIAVRCFRFSFSPIQIYLFTLLDGMDHCSSFISLRSYTL